MKNDRVNATHAAIRCVDLVGRMFASVLVVAIAMILAGLLASAARAQSEPASPSLIVKLVAGLSVDDQAAVIARNGGVETSAIPALRLHVVAVSADEVDQVADHYRADPQVVRVEINNLRRSNTLPSDPLYPQQWALPKIGWDLVFGNPPQNASVVVAVLDTGIDETHPDLFGNVIAGTSILDGSNGLTDPSGHGTMVAGTVAARTDTTPPEGMAGIAYAGVRLMPVTVLDADGLGQDSDIIAGVIWAVEHGATVILMAFSNPGFSESLQEAIDYAWASNVVLVAAAGNEGLNAPTYPAGDRGVIGVSATDENDQLASFSNYGPSVFLAAPGTDVLTTDTGGTYVAINGTSSSAAIVAGAAAQMMSIDPTLTNGIIVGRLARTADPAGTQEETGNGRLNLARALLDTGIDFVQPAGAAPVGGGGPFVGPYTAAAPSLTLTPNSGPSGTSVTLTSGGSLFSGGATNIGIYWDGAISTTSGTLVATCSANGGGNIVAGCTFTVSSSVAGLHTVVATQKNSLAKSVSTTFSITKASQTITFDALPGRTYSDADFAVTATATSGLAVSFSSQTPLTCTVSSNTVHIVAAGSCTIRASQAGDSNYEAAPNVDQSFNIDPASQTITVTQHAPPIATYSSSFTVAATGGASGNPVTIAISGACSGSGNDSALVTMTSGSGTCSVTYNQLGNSNFIAATQVTEATTAQKATQMITVTTHAPSTAVYNTSFTVAASGGGSANPVTFSSAGVCTNVAATFTMISGTGTCSVKYDQAGNDNYAAAPQVVEATTAQKASQLISFGALPAKTYGDPDFAVSASASSGLAVDFTTAGSCTNAGNNVHIAGAGNCAVTAHQGGNANYNAAADVTQSFFIGQATPKITVIGGSYFYDMSSHAATCVVEGVFGESVSGSCTLLYNGSGTPPSAVATYAVAAAFVSNDANYTDATGSGTLSIVGVSLTTTPTGPQAVGSAGSSPTVNVSIIGSASLINCVIDWDDGTDPYAGTGSGSCSAAHTYSSAGVYEPKAAVSSGDIVGTGYGSYQFIVIYDPAAGFVTGGGWIMSPVGASVQYPLATGRASFGFNSKYQKGANVPSGDTEFQFRAGDLNFKSTVYEWLVISGAKAQYRGSGTINGAGNYGFLLTATDGDVKGGNGVDMFRIKIWDRTSGLIVYDNAPGSDDIDMSAATALGGGSIVIHK